MMGHHDGSEALFYHFRPEDQVPESHLLRLIEKHISFEFVRESLRDSYSELGRPSIDPELPLRILLLGLFVWPHQRAQAGFGEFASIDLVTLVALFEHCHLARIAHQQFGHVWLEQIVQPGRPGSFLEGDR